MAEETNRPIVEAQQESTKVLSEAIAKLEKTVATSNGATEEGQTQLKDAVLSSAKPDPKVKETEEKQSSFLERIQKSMQGMNLAAAKERMGTMRTDAAEAFQKRKDAIMNSRSVGLLKTMSGNITKFTKGFLGSIKDKAKLGIKGFLIATGLLMLINFLESEEWQNMKKKLKEFDFKQLGKDIDALIAGFSNMGEGVLSYFLGKKTGKDGERDDSGLFSRLGKIKRGFTEDGLIGGFTSMFENLSGLEFLFAGAMGLYFAKKTGILFLAGKIFGKKGLFSMLFKALGGVAAYFGLMKPAVDKLTKKTLANAVKADPSLGKAHMTKDGKVIRELTPDGKPNPRYNMAVNMSKPPPKVPVKPPKPPAVKPPSIAKLQKLMAARAASKSLLKKVPGLGLIAGGAFGIMKLLEGDKVGAGMEFASGLASTVPGAGTAASAGIDVAILMREMERNKELLPKLQAEQETLQKKMAARARVAEMFGLKGGEGLRGKSVEELKGLVANFKERFGTTKLSDEQKKMLLESGFFKSSGFFGKKGVAELAGGFNLSNLRRMQQLNNVMNQDDSAMKQADAQLTDFISTIQAVNGELKNLKKEVETQQTQGGNQQITQVNDLSKKEVQSAPVHVMQPRNAYGGTSPW